MRYTYIADILQNVTILPFNIVNDNLFFVIKFELMSKSKAASSFVQNIDTSWFLFQYICLRIFFFCDHYTSIWQSRYLLFMPAYSFGANMLSDIVVFIRVIQSLSRLDTNCDRADGLHFPPLIRMGVCAKGFTGYALILIPDKPALQSACLHAVRLRFTN